MAELRDNQYELHWELINQCKQNDSKAQCTVYSMYYRAMYHSCLRIIKDVSTAEDVMQEAFLTAFEKIGSFKGESAFGAWLKKIVIHKSLDEIKKKRPVFDSLENAYEAFSIEDEGFDEDKEMDLTGKINRIKQALNLLPDGYRIIVSLYLFEGYDHEEISGILGITESTSRSQFSRAKHKLLELLNMVE
jgi:RNA polymerase sigma factor (sigma-70 family)